MHARNAMILVSIGLVAFLVATFLSSHAQTTEGIDRAELVGLPEVIALTARGAGYLQDDTVLFNWRTNEVQVLVDEGRDDNHATWSPDGTQLAYQTRETGDWEIFLVDVASSETTNLTQNSTASDMYPNWTPDGLVVHFSTRSGQEALWVTNPADLTAEDLTSGDDCVPDYHPNWSPNDDYLAYRADCAGSGDIWRLEFATDTRINLTVDSSATERYPAWSPDGSQILFVSNREGTEDIFVMDADGNNVRNLTDSPSRDKQASWSPDGQFILFISDRDGRDDLWIMDADGGRQTLLLTTVDVDYDWPWWQPMPENMEDTMSTNADADVVFVRAQLSGENTWRFDVTVAHPDSGWDDYADGWDVVLPDGTVVKPDADSPFTRLLLHPHENEQPFTRSQSGVVIPAVVTMVTVRAHDIVDGFGGQEVVVDLTLPSGDNFEVVR